MNNSNVWLLLAAVICVPVYALPVAAQSPGPTTVAEMITVCTPIIDEQYQKDNSRWGSCVAATQAFLEYAIPRLQTPEEVETAVALTVEELVKLYRVQECTVAQTELPLAISTAESFTTNEVQLIAIREIAAAVSDCQNIATAAIQTFVSTDTV